MAEPIDAQAGGAGAKRRAVAGSSGESQEKTAPSPEHRALGYPAFLDALPTRLSSYEVRRRLGAGGMGVVFEAQDLERDRRVALKLLPALEPEALQRFKREFRTVEHLAHPNLATVYELVFADGLWFFSMELIDGLNFRAHLFREERSEARTRRAFEQLVLGVHALHEASLLHLDLKPANVLVDRSGRVVLVDFGLVQAVRAADRSRRPKVAGTPEYMSPEQARGEAPTAASDWYSVGVMLFEALSGDLPFRGRTHAELLLAKVNADAPSIALLEPGAPRDLAELCDRLLCRDPARRPGGLEVLQALGVSPTPPAGRPTWSPLGLASKVLIGRERELAMLEDGVSLAARDRPVGVLVHGPSGMGKSSLLRAFRERIRSRSGTLVLSGRCYERETLPFKAFDSVIDALSDHLKSLPEDSVTPLIPEDIELVGRLFPVLFRVEAVRRRGAGADLRLDPRELQRRGFRALKQLLSRVARQRKLVVLIDDLQWGDQDSARLLAELMAPPDEPGLMLAGAFRSEEADGPFLRELLRHWEQPGGRGLRRVIELGPLSVTDAAAMAERIIGGDRSEGTTQTWLMGSATVSIVARESGGNPLVVEQLAEAAAYERDQLSPEPLQALLLRRISRLPPEARRLLEAIAVAGQPIEQRVALRAAELPGDRGPVLAMLRSVRLVRTRGAREADGVECYHDLVRETVSAAVDATELPRVHRRLAEALEWCGAGTDEQLALHWYGAADAERAARHALAAADRAAEALAFERAAELYARALEWGNYPDDFRREVTLRRADALVAAGHARRAAELYLEAASGAPRARALVLRGAAAEQHLVSGKVDEGTAILRELLPDLGLSYPESPGAAALGIALRMLWLRLRGFAFRERQDLSPERASRIDLGHSAAKGLIAVDSIRGAYFSLVSLLDALGAGDARRVARGLAMVGGTVLAAAGGGLSRWGARMIEEAERISERHEDRYASGFIAVCRGQVAILSGAWSEVVAHSDRGVSMLRSGCRGVAWECDVGRMGALRGLEELGRWNEVEERSLSLLREAEDRGDLYPRVTAALFAAAARLARDDVSGARTLAAEARRSWSRGGFHVQHFYAMRVEAWCDLYEGRPAQALERIDSIWSAIEASHLLRVPVARADALLLRARAAVGRAVSEDGDREAAEVIALRDLAALEREKRPDLAAQVLLLRAGLTCRDEARAAALLAEAVRLFHALGMSSQWAAAQLCWGSLTGGSEGRDAAEEARALLRECGVADPDRWAALRAPALQTRLKR